MSEAKPSPSKGIPKRLLRIKEWLRLKLKYGFSHVRLSKIPLLHCYYRLQAFRSVVSFFEKIPHPKISRFLFIVLAALYFTVLILRAHPCSKEETELLRSLLVSGLLIAPLIGMLNNGFTYIISVYLKVFDKNEYSKEHSLEPRLHRLRGDARFIQELIKFENKREIKNYVAYAKDTIDSSISYRSDIDYRSSFSTILIGMGILIGFVLILLNLLEWALFILMVIYISLIIKNVSVFRTTIKLWLLEVFLSSIIEDINLNTPKGKKAIMEANL